MKMSSDRGRLSQPRPWGLGRPAWSDPQNPGARTPKAQAPPPLLPGTRTLRGPIRKQWAPTVGLGAACAPRRRLPEILEIM